MPPIVTPGNVIFYSDCRPPLPAGDYTLEVGQEVKKGSTPVDAPGPALPPARPHKFAIVGPRFSLNPDEIHGVFPPDNSQGHFESRLPMVVLRRRTLPWERRIEGAPNSPATTPPWMAVLLFEEGEVTLLDPPDCTVGAIVDGDPAIGVRAITLPNLTAGDRAQKCLGIQVSLATLRQVAPTVNELNLLTHVRQVSTEDKELLGMDEDGWFAVVVGNRLPEGGKKYIACLVSLEGQFDQLPTSEEAVEFTANDLNNVGGTVVVDGELVVDGGLVVVRERGVFNEGSARGDSLSESIAFANASFALAPRRGFSGIPSSVVFDRNTSEWTPVFMSSVRLITLARWSFTCVGGGDFEQLMKELPRRGGVAMLGMAQQDAVAAGVNPRTNYRVALDSGHVPLAHETREGEHVTAWYRGPLVPAGVARETGGPYHTADQARRIDPLTGLESVGYAAAFEIGRLLALSDPRFALELLRWRRDGSNRIAQAVNDKQLLDRVPEILDQRRFLFPHEYHRVITRHLIEDIGPRIESQELLGALSDPTGLLNISEFVPGLSAEAVVRATQFDAGIVSALLDTSLEGRGTVLGSLGVGAQLTLESNFDALSGRTAEQEFGYLNLIRNEGFKQGEF
jgi:hypothetical protein